MCGFIFCWILLCSQPCYEDFNALTTSVTNPFSSLSGSSFLRVCEREEAGGCWSLLRVALTFARGFSSHKNGPGLEQRLANLFISDEAHSARRRGVPRSVFHFTFFSLLHFLASLALFHLLDGSQNKSGSSSGDCIGEEERRGCDASAQCLFLSSAFLFLGLKQSASGSPEKGECVCGAASSGHTLATFERQ